MKIILAFDSFKGSYSASEITLLAEKELKHLVSNAIIKCFPLADGGEGTLEVLQSLPGSQILEAKVTGPLPDMQVIAKYLYFSETRSIFVEMAQAAGITHLQADQLNPYLTTTFGVGEIIRQALTLNPEHIYLAVGGSATNDLGSGMAKALGWKFLKSNQESISLGARELDQIKHIIPTKLNLPPVTVLCDVNNPLCGINGASMVYAPQKGASTQDCQILDRKLASFAKQIHLQLDKDIANLPGAGAAGGLAAGALAFLNAHLQSGIDSIMNLIQLEAELQNADWIITGEGCFDEQSLSGKVVSGLLQRKPQKCKLAVIAGFSKVPEEIYKKHGIDLVCSLATAGMTTEEAMNNTEKLLKNSIKSWFSSI